MKPRPTVIRWTCSDLVKHQHRTQRGAWACGRVQRLLYSFRRPRSLIVDIALAAAIAILAMGLPVVVVLLWWGVLGGGV